MRKKCALILLTGVMTLTLAAENAAWADETGNMVFFRGGYAKMDHDRGGDLLTNGANLLGPNAVGANGEGVNGGDDGWYFGAGFDFLDAIGRGQQQGRRPDLGARLRCRSDARRTSSSRGRRSIRRRGRAGRRSSP